MGISGAWQTDRCVFIEKGRKIYLPVAHGEGRIVLKDQPTLERLPSGGSVAFKYLDENGNKSSYPMGIPTAQWPQSPD